MNDTPQNPDGTPARWWRQFLSAVRLNAGDGYLAWIAASRVSGAAPAAGEQDVLALEDAALYVRRVLPYHFEGRHHRVLELEAAIRRGYGACADATAAICAVALFRGVDVDCCYEDLERSAGPLHGYAHVRVAVGDRRVDAYPDKSLELPCSGRFRVTRERARWPATAARPVEPVRVVAALAAPTSSTEPQLVEPLLEDGDP